MAETEAKQQRLKYVIEGDRLVISIGIDTLKFATESSEWVNPWNDESLTYQQSFRITDSLQFAKDVLMELEREKEDGSTPITRLLDKACEDAVNQGSIAVEEITNEQRI